MSKPVRSILSLLLVLLMSLFSLGVNAELLPDHGTFPYVDLPHSGYESFSAASDSMDSSQTAATAALNPNCRAAVLMEGSTGEILFEKNADEKLPIASVTKVMTLLIVMEAIDDGALQLTDIVTVSDNAASMGGSQAYMEPNEQMTVDEMLKAVVVSSANDGAVALAEHVAGSVPAFLEIMNRRAEELGMTSVFQNVTGLDDSEVHYVSARDVALMSRELLKHKTIFNYTGIWMDTIRGGAFGLSNTNKLIRFYPGANGLKTGSTSKAKYCISASAVRNDMQLIAVILSAPTSDDRFSSAKQLLDYGFAAYAVYQPPEIKIEPVRVWGGKSSYSVAQFDAPILLVKKGQESKITSRVDISSELNAPVERGQIIGHIVHELNGEKIAESPIMASESIGRLTMGDLFRKLLKELSFG